jgi:hypothetical protein
MIWGAAAILFNPGPMRMISRVAAGRLAVVLALSAAVTAAAVGETAAATYRPGTANCSKKRHRSHGHFRARLYAPGHTAKADEKWPIRVTARTLSGRPLRGHIYYQFVFSGQIVACRTVGAPGKPRFRGTFRDDVIFPKRAVGVPLIFRVVLTTSRGLRNLDYRVTIQA